MFHILSDSDGKRVVHKSVLVVDGDPDDAAHTVRTLRISLVMNEVVVAHDGGEALDYLFGTGIFRWRDTAIQPQLILLDLKLPMMGALELLTRLRVDPRTALQPVAVLASRHEKMDVLLSRDLGPTGYLPKPVEPRQLIDVVRQFRLYCLLPTPDR